nr:hypothetical protein GCM10020093_096320 [Planobispora longispora]
MTGRLGWVVEGKGWGGRGEGVVGRGGGGNGRAVTIGASASEVAGVDFRVLGPVEVIGDDGTPLDVGSYQQRVVLALCALAAPRPVPLSRVVDVLWGTSRPRGGQHRPGLRLQAPPGLRAGQAAEHAPAILVSRPGGYALEIPETGLDLSRARAHAAEGRRRAAAGDHRGAGRSSGGRWASGAGNR